MGTFACVCGHVIRDSLCPCPDTGYLTTQTELDSQAEARERDVTAFIEAMKNERRSEWIHSYFNSHYPTSVSDAEVIYDIYNTISFGSRRHFYQCPVCDRLYLQKAAGLNKWVCFEKADN